MPTLQTTLRPGIVRINRKANGTLQIEQDFRCRIKADSLAQERPTILLETEGTPKYGYAFGEYGMMLKGSDGDRLDDDPLLWDCVYNLTNTLEEGENSSEDGTLQTGDPTLWVPVVTLGYETYEEVFTKSLPILEAEKHPDIGGSDADGYNARKWTNSAGQPYETGFVRQRRIITRDFVQFERIRDVDVDPEDAEGAYTLDEIEARNETLNLTEYQGKPPRTLKLTVEAVSAGFYYGFRCWRVDYKLAYKKDDWRLKKLDVGTFYKSAGDKLPFLDDDENNIVGSLDGNGAAAADQTDPAVRYHKEFESLEFADILYFPVEEE